MASLLRLLASAGLSVLGVPIRFVLPSAQPEDYEASRFHRGEVAHRAGSLRDLFNALVWLEFPQAKAVINRQHHVLARQALLSEGKRERGPMRDALTQFDECGAVVVGTHHAIRDGLQAHRWRDVFVRQRDVLAQTTRCIVFGHASHAALPPFIGMCGKAVFVEVDEAGLAQVDANGPKAVDAALARRLARADFSARDLQPLPLLGIPDASPENDNPACYDDMR